MTTPDDAVHDSNARPQSPSVNGHWIKLFKTLFDHPKVFSICERLSCIEITAVGGLACVWAIADTHSTDGRLEMSARALNRKLNFDGFAEAMEAVGWLEIGEGFVNIVRFDEHNGQCAKRRAQDAVRAAKYRQSNQTGDTVTQERDASVTQRKSKKQDSEEHNNNTHASMKHESCRKSLLNRSEDYRIRMTNILPEHVRRIVRERDGPLYLEYFADAVRAGWAKDCDVDRNKLAALFHQVVRIGKAKDPGRVICKSWKERDNKNPKQCLKLAKEDEDFATLLLRPKPLTASPVAIAPMKSSAGDLSEARPATPIGDVKTQVGKLQELEKRLNQNKPILSTRKEP